MKEQDKECEPKFLWPWGFTAGGRRIYFEYAETKEDAEKLSKEKYGEKASIGERTEVVNEVGGISFVLKRTSDDQGKVVESNSLVLEKKLKEIKIKNKKVSIRKLRQMCGLSWWQKIKKYFKNDK